MRTLVDPNIPGDMEKVHALQDGVKIEQPGGPGKFKIPKWAPVSQKKVRDALIVLATTLTDTSHAFGLENEVDPVQRLISAAATWGGDGASFGMGSRNRSGRWTGAGRIRERRGFGVRLSDLVCAVRLIAQPAAGEQHFDQKGDEGAHCEKQRQTKGHE